MYFVLDDWSRVVNLRCYMETGSEISNKMEGCNRFSSSSRAACT